MVQRVQRFRKDCGGDDPILLTIRRVEKVGHTVVVSDQREGHAKRSPYGVPPARRQGARPAGQYWSYRMEALKSDVRHLWGFLGIYGLFQVFFPVSSGFLGFYLQFSGTFVVATHHKSTSTLWAVMVPLNPGCGVWGEFGAGLAS